MRSPAFWLTCLVATLYLSVGIAFAQQIPGSDVTVVVNRDNVNIRLIPALGAEVIGHANAGTTFNILARSPDNEWFKIHFSGEEGWIGAVVVTVLSGDINTLPVADPRTIPYGGFESPRAGLTSATSPIQGRLDDNGVRVRAGPSRAYPVLANAPRRTVFPLLGRTFNNAWLQVNYEGTLGWVSAPEVTILDAADFTVLPIDGIVAEALPISDATADDFFSTLRLMRDRVNLAQPSLDATRAIWTEIALGGRAACGSYPARPSDYNVPNPLLAAYYDTLFPLAELFNNAMANLRRAIDLHIESCSFPQPAAGSVGQATVQAALDLVNQTDVQFAELRRRLNELIPPDFVVDPDECLFIYETAYDVLKLVEQQRIYVDHLTPKDTLTGYCFDAAEGETLTISALVLNGNISLFLAVSPFDNPTNFLAVQSGTVDRIPVSVTFTTPVTGRYLLIVNDIGGQTSQRTEAPFGDFAFMIRNPQLPDPDPANTLDLETGRPPVGVDVMPLLTMSVAPVLPGFPTPIPGLALTVVPGVFATPIPGMVTTPVPGAFPGIVPEAVFCPSLSLTCEQLTCEQARACLIAGNFALDPDRDNIPCNCAP
ncbi:MAG: SH3 domain-containing protein [Chloroflexota bacterium]|nr:MAG: hypothetical protein DIU68_14375 [Chloroflexota bacterium]